jgi:hypothetical protein
MLKGEAVAIPNATPVVLSPEFYSMLILVSVHLLQNIRLWPLKPSNLSVNTESFSLLEIR